jgi:hypothetical protein
LNAPKWEKKMKRFLLLLFLLLLVVDLADDGGFGKVTFVAPTSTAETSYSTPQSCSGKVDCRYLLVAEGGETSCLMHLHPVTLEIQPALKIVLATNIGSAGGIPWKSSLLQ